MKDTKALYTYLEADELPCAACEGGTMYRPDIQTSGVHKSCSMCTYVRCEEDDDPCCDCVDFSDYLVDARRVVFETQVGGSHYKNPNVPAGFPDPAEFCIVHGLGGAESNIIKYVFRHDKKNGIEDLRKAKQYLEFLAACRYNVIL